MSTLFVKTGCPFCAKVITTFDAQGISFEEKNIADENNAAELMVLGGKRQVPFLVDGDVLMYESDDIVSYIEEKYGATTTDVETKIPPMNTGGTCSV
ncbi:MAG: glutathione S-transferase N-terminal domain-containing protein [Candidatus Pacebacteria bacterium]|nr:glutathione S-transferase N-terminal domain-containing protein [Candidatus Paceibacterota bacterium]MCF7857171.1 glutathione S-transferase N-terminal domain-containing protein [Candidatus Paceibacterota bacterium]